MWLSTSRLSSHLWLSPQRRNRFAFWFRREAAMGSFLDERCHGRKSKWLATLCDHPSWHAPFWCSFHPSTLCSQWCSDSWALGKKAYLCCSAATHQQRDWDHRFPMPVHLTSKPAPHHSEERAWRTWRLRWSWIGAPCGWRGCGAYGAWWGWVEMYIDWARTLKPDFDLDQGQVAMSTKRASLASWMRLVLKEIDYCCTLTHRSLSKSSLLGLLAFIEVIIAGFACFHQVLHCLTHSCAYRILMQPSCIWPAAILHCVPCLLRPHGAKVQPLSWAQERQGSHGHQTTRSIENKVMATSSMCEGKAECACSGVRQCIGNARFHSSSRHQPSALRIVQILIKDKILPDWSGKVCPKCNQGKLSLLKVNCGETVPMYRCCSKACQQRVHPHYLHPLFQACRGPEALSLQTQAALLLLLLLRVSQAAIHVALGVNHEVVENMQRRLEQIRHDHVIKKEKEIVLGESSTWAEGDEDRADETHHALWEQRSGLVQPGKPETLILSPLIPENTFTQLVPYNDIICLICSTVLNGWLWNHLTKIIVLTEFVFHAVCTDDTHKNGRLSGG